MSRLLERQNTINLKTPSVPILTICITGLTIGLLLAHNPFLHPALTYTIVFIATSLVYCWMCWIIYRIEISRKTVFLAVGVALLVRLSFLTATPIGSDDIYRYMWDGKVQAAGLNPYLYAPDSSALDHLHSPLLPASVNHPDMKTLYFPFSEWIFYACYQLSGEAPWGYKLILFFAEIASIAGLLLLLGRFKLPPKFVLFYALCPLPIIQFALDSHLDALGFPFLIVGLLMYLRGRTILSSFLLGLSMAVKPVALVLLPILFFRERTWKKRVQILGVPLATITIQFLPYLLSSNPFEALFTFAKNWTFNGLVFEGLYLFLADNQKARLICVILLSVVLLILYFSKQGLLDKVHHSVLLLLLFSPVVHPWYIAWLTVLLPLTRRWSGIVYAATASLTSVTILHYKLHGVWDQSPFVLVVEYLPVLVLMVQELRTGDPSRATV